MNNEVGYLLQLVIIPVLIVIAIIVGITAFLVSLVRRKKSPGIVTSEQDKIYKKRMIIALLAFVVIYGVASIATQLTSGN